MKVCWRRANWLRLLGVLGGELAANELPAEVVPAVGVFEEDLLANDVADDKIVRFLYTTV